MHEGSVLYLCGVSLGAAMWLHPRSDLSTNTFWGWSAICANTFAQKKGGGDFHTKTVLKHNGTGLSANVGRRTLTVFIDPTRGVNNGKKMLPVVSCSWFDRLKKMEALLFDWTLCYVYY